MEVIQLRSAKTFGSWFFRGDFQINRLIVLANGRPVVLNLAGEAHEGLLDVPASLGTDLQEEHVMLLRQFLRLLLLDLAIVSEVCLGADEDLADGLAGVALDLLDPAADVLEGLLVINPVGEDDAAGALVVGLRDVAEALLPRRVPDLQADLGVVDSDGLDLEIHADGRHVAVLEHPFAKLSQQVRLPHAAVPDDDHLRQEVLLCLLRRHSSIIIIKEYPRQGQSQIMLLEGGTRQNGVFLFGLEIIFLILALVSWPYEGGKRIINQMAKSIQKYWIIEQTGSTLMAHHTKSLKVAFPFYFWPSMAIDGPYPNIIKINTRCPTWNALSSEQSFFSPPTPSTRVPRNATSSTRPSASFPSWQVDPSAAASASNPTARSQSCLSSLGEQSWSWTQASPSPSSPNCLSLHSISPPSREAGKWPNCIRPLSIWHSSFSSSETSVTLGRAGQLKQSRQQK